MKFNLLERQNTKEKQSRLRMSSSWLAIGAALIVSACGAGHEKKQPLEKAQRYLMQTEMSDAFHVDEAHMSAEEKKEFEKQITGFLHDHDNPDGVQQLSGSRITLEVSSDERNTKKWKGGNEELSEARAKEIKDVYYHLIDTLRAQKSFSQFSGFFAKKINTRIAVSPEHGRGVTSLDQLKNPLTGKHYTPEELSKLSKEELEKLYDQCRYIKILIEKPQEGDRIRQYTELVKILADFPVTRIVLDRSGSMDEENHIFANEIAGALVGDKTGFSSHDNKIVSFSEVVDWDNYSTLRSKEDVVNFMNKTWTRGGDEHQFLAVTQMMDKLDAEYGGGSAKERKPSAIVMLSDDGVNDFSIEQLTEIISRSEKTNTTIFFAFINDESPEKLITMVDAKGLLSEFHEFVTRFDHDEYFPKDNMTTEEKERYFLESMKAYAKVDEEHPGIEVDKNGNVHYQFLFSSFQENVSARYKKFEERARDWYVRLDVAYGLKFQDNQELYKAGKITYEELEKRNEAVQLEKDKAVEELSKKIQAEQERLQALYDAVAQK